MALANWTEYHRSVVDGGASLAIPIMDRQQHQIAVLKPLTVIRANEGDVLRDLTEWRERNSRYFLSQFQPTVERTRSWLLENLKDSSRMLFLIYCDDMLYGHYGFRDMRNGSALLDNLIRGRTGGHPALMNRAVLALSRWLISDVGLSEVYGYVLTDNPYALKLHKEIGFEFREKIPLIPQADGSLTMGMADAISPVDKYYRKIVMSDATGNSA